LKGQTGTAIKVSVSFFINKPLRDGETIKTKEFWKKSHQKREKGNLEGYPRGKLWTWGSPFTVSVKKRYKDRKKIVKRRGKVRKKSKEGK